jgi:hypothetical protein
VGFFEQNQFNQTISGQKLPPIPIRRYWVTTQRPDTRLTD